MYIHHTSENEALVKIAVRLFHQNCALPEMRSFLHKILATIEQDGMQQKGRVQGSVKP